MFQEATRLKLRFNYKGILSVEDLWDLTLKELDEIYKNLNLELKTVSEESLLEKDSEESKEVRLAVNIVKHIFTTKQAEQNAREKEIQKAAQKQRLLEIIADKQDEKFREMSVDELTNLVNEL